MSEYCKNCKDLADALSAMTERAQTAELDIDWLKGRIQDGELVPVELIYDIVGDFHAPNNSWRHLESYAKMRAQQFAAQKAKEETK